MTRRARVGLASFGLTLVWGGALFVAFIGNRIAQHPSPPAALAAIGSFCAAASGILLTLACFPRLAELLRPVGQVAALGAALEAAAVLWAGLPTGERVPDLWNELEFSNFLLLPSMVALLGSSVLIFTRWCSNRASRARFEPTGAVQSLFLLFRRQHRLLGWAALAFAGAHSVYYLLTPGPPFVQWTGIAATALLGGGGLLGLVTSYTTVLRLWAHRVIAVLVIVALGLHWGPFLPTATLALVALFAASLVHLKLVSGLGRLVAGTAGPA